MSSNQVQEIHAIVDRSGSMRGKESDTIGGLRAAMDELRSSMVEGDTINVSIKYFDDKQDLMLRSSNLTQMTEAQFDLIFSQYCPRGSTALLDALGDSLTYFCQKKLTEPESFKSCVIYVTTDGLENASKKYTYQTISDMIKSSETEHNIRVLYLGANQDAIAEASKCGISMERAINYTESQENTQAVYRSAAAVATRTRTTGNSEFAPVERVASCASPRSSSVPVRRIETLTPPPVTRRPNMERS